MPDGLYVRLRAFASPADDAPTEPLRAARRDGGIAGAAHHSLDAERAIGSRARHDRDRGVRRIKNHEGRRTNDERSMAFHPRARNIYNRYMAHVYQWHSLDALLCDLLCVFQWFNPAAWLLRRDLREVHEYEADEKVISRGIDSKQYQMLLIRRTVGECAFALANSFNQKSLKRRITMMKKQKTNGWQSLRALTLLPVGALAVVAFAHPSVSKVEQAVEEVAAPVEIRQTATEVKTDTIGQVKTYDVVDEMPQFPGGISALGIWIGENIKYPQSCVDQGIEGRVIVTFVVDKSGEVRDAKVMRSIAPELDAEALRVVMAMPRWIPGKQNGEAVHVKFTIPLSFKIPESDKEENKELEN